MVDLANETTIVGNNLYNNGADNDSAIYVSRGDNVVISSNNIYDNTSGAGTSYGIQLSADADYVYLSANEINGSGFDDK